MTSWLGRILLGLLIFIIFYESDKWIFEVKKRQSLSRKTQLQKFKVQKFV